MPINEVNNSFQTCRESELKLVKDSGYKKFPPRLPEQPISYPVVNRDYAVQIAQNWNTKDGEKGYATMFKISSDYISKFEIHRVGSEIHDEYRIDAGELENFNSNIIGDIKIIESFRGSSNLNN